MQNQCIIRCTTDNTQISKMIYQCCIILIGERYYFTDIENIMLNQLLGDCRCNTWLNRQSSKNGIKFCHRMSRHNALIGAIFDLLQSKQSQQMRRVRSYHRGH